ncbi:unnamed protein product [Oikopleura dioica]|uniref:Methyltransferase domain-containing protein n=1 Tax=Oikopleura dioica TaxID=34765 RepID=E4YM02_OIKDI|nr:unnamed protein product [Oikopleura dioica]
MIEESEHIAAQQMAAAGKSEVKTDQLFAPQKPIESIAVENSIEQVQKIIEEQSKKEEVVKEIEPPRAQPKRNIPHMPMALQPQAGFGSPQEEIDRLYDYMTKQIECPDLHYVGTAGNKGTYQDGAYAGCLEEGWWPKKGEPCLGYSFGIDYEWSWDEGMEALGCQVHSFDPGMYDEPEHAKHSELIYFHRYGLGDVDSDALYQTALRDYAYRKKYGDAKLNELRKWKVRTLPSIIDELGHRGRIIDAVKIDIEGPRHGYEDKTIKSILETGAWKCIRQLSLELHVFGPAKDANYIRLQFSVMKALEDHGFKLFDVKESFGRDMSDIKQKITTEKTELLWCLGWWNPNVVPCE